MFDIIFVDQLSISIPLLKNFTTARVRFARPLESEVVLTILTQILFYCHFPDQLLTKRTNILKALYRFPVDYLEEITTGAYLSFFFSSPSTSSHIYTMKGAADKILVNSKFTASIFRQTFKRLGHIKPHVLYPAINFAQYKLEGNTEGQKKKKTNKDKALEDQVVFLSLNRYERKKNINLAIKAFAELKQSRPRQFPKLKLIIAGIIFKHICSFFICHNTRSHPSLSPPALSSPATTTPTHNTHLLK